MHKDTLEHGYFYHIYNRANNFELMFYESKNYYYFLELVKKYLVPVCDIYAFCLMQNHYHFLLRVKEIDEMAPDLRNKPVSQFFSNMFNAYTKAINKHL